jgi:hypothetical protein
MQKENVLTLLTVLATFAIVIGFFHQWILTY